MKELPAAKHGTGLNFSQGQFEDEVFNFFGPKHMSAPLVAK